MDNALKRIVWLFVASPLACLAFVWSRLPLQIPLHFTLRGVPDRYGGKNELAILILVLAIINAGVFLLLTNASRIDPRKKASENNPRLLRIAFAVSLFIAFVSCIIIYSSLNSDIQPGIKMIFAGVGLLLCLVGNYMYNIKPNYYAGIRLPWTLNNEDNWRKTHLLGGKLLFVAGLLIAATSFWLPFPSLLIALAVILGTTILITCIYSYRLYKTQKNVNTAAK